MGRDEVSLEYGFDETLRVTTAQDWSTYADAVVEAAVVEEHLRYKLDFTVVPREITLQFKDVVWQSDEGAGHRLPDQVILNVVGWRGDANDPPSDVDEAARIAIPGEPRLDLGHTYLVALYWESQPCEPNSDGGAFELLSGSGVLPYDNAMVGVGEVEGSVRTRTAAAAAVAEPGSSEYGLDDVAFGWSASRVARLLDSTPPRKAGDLPHPDPEGCGD